MKLTEQQQEIIDLTDKLSDAEKVLKAIAINLTANPDIMKELDPNWCCDQECLDLINAYFDKKGENK